MKIAVVHNLPAGGMKRALYEQVKRLAKKHTVDIYTLSCSDETFLPLKEFAHRYTIFRYDPPPHFPASVFSIYFKLPKVYKEIAEMINKAHIPTKYFPLVAFSLGFAAISSLYF